MKLKQLNKCVPFKTQKHNENKSVDLTPDGYPKDWSQHDAFVRREHLKALPKELLIEKPREAFSQVKAFTKNFLAGFEDYSGRTGGSDDYPG